MDKPEMYRGQQTGRSGGNKGRHGGAGRRWTMAAANRGQRQHGRALVAAARPGGRCRGRSLGEQAAAIVGSDRAARGSGGEAAATVQGDKGDVASQGYRQRSNGLTGAWRTPMRQAETAAAPMGGDVAPQGETAAAADTTGAIAGRRGTRADDGDRAAQSGGTRWRRQLMAIADIARRRRDRAGDAEGDRSANRRRQQSREMRAIALWWHGGAARRRRGGAMAANRWQH